MIIASNVSKHQQAEGVDNVSVTCNKGECIAHWTYGSGKTTFNQEYTGMVVPDSGL